MHKRVIMMMEKNLKEADSKTHWCKKVVLWCTVCSVIAFVASRLYIAARTEHCCTNNDFTSQFESDLTHMPVLNEKWVGASQAELLAESENMVSLIAETHTVQAPELSKYLIPRIVHQTWYESPMEHPGKYYEASLLQTNWADAADWTYMFWDDEKAISFLKEHFVPDVVDTFTALIPPAFKADVLRYCLLYHFGGVYSDIDVKLMDSVKTNSADKTFGPGLNSLFGPEISFAVPGEPGHSPSCGAWNGLMAASPKHPYVELALKQAILHVKNRFSGKSLKPANCWEYDLDRDFYNHLYLTGPGLLGGSISRLAYNETCTNLLPGVYKLNNSPGKTLLLGRVSSNFYDAAMEKILFTTPPMHDLDALKKKRKKRYETLFNGGGGDLYND
eukprot:m.69896 g.69896  ORF g.69896 m.69896 type:complete len:389 (-) comp24151_c1_seq1:49-1215(-)